MKMWNTKKQSNDDQPPDPFRRLEEREIANNLRFYKGGLPATGRSAEHYFNVVRVLPRHLFDMSETGEQPTHQLCAWYRVRRNAETAILFGLQIDFRICNYDPDALACSAGDWLAQHLSTKAHKSPIGVATVFRSPQSAAYWNLAIQKFIDYRIFTAKINEQR